MANKCLARVERPWGVTTVILTCITIVYMALLTPLSTAAPVIHGGLTGCLLRQDGIHCWGLSENGAAGYDNATQVPLYAPPLNFSITDLPLDVSVGYDSVCALFTNTQRCWGRNDYGQLAIDSNIPCCGNETDLHALPAAKLSGADHTGSVAHQIQMVYSFEAHRCATYNRLDSDSRPHVRCWGRDNGDEALGFYPAGKHNPISLGNDNGYGDQAGEMTTIPWLQFADTQRVLMLAGGLGHTCALFTGGGIRCWGLSDHGQTGLSVKAGYATPLIGDNERNRYRRTSSLYTGTALSAIDYLTFQTTHPAMYVAAGGKISCAIFFNAFTAGTKRRMRCWGDNRHGALGRDDTVSRGSAATDIPNLAYIDFKTTSEIGNVAVGAHHACAVFVGGVRCWGDNSHGQCGQDNDVVAAYGVSTTPAGVSITDINYVSFADAKRPVHVYAGGNVSCSLFDYDSGDARLRCWGQNDKHQLGLTHSDGQDKGLAFGEVRSLKYIPDPDPDTHRMIVHSVKPFGFLADSEGIVRITGPGLHFTSSILVCRFQDPITNAVSQDKAVVISSEEIQCKQPNWVSNMGVAKVVNLKLLVTRATGAYTDTHVPLKVYPPPENLELNPKGGPLSGGTVVTLSGDKIRFIQEPILCRFGNNPATIVHGKIVGETGAYGGSLVCDPTIANANATTVGDVDFYYSLNGFDWAKGPTFKFYKLTFSLLAPASGPLTGSTKAILYGSPPLITTGDLATVTMSDGLSLNFNLSAGYDPATKSYSFVSPSISQFESNLALPHPMTLKISINGDNNWQDIPFKFNYYALPAIQRIEPNSAPLVASGARQKLELFGSNFSPLSGIVVRFYFTDSSYADAVGTYNEATGTIFCTAPDSTVSGEIYIELSLNAGVAFTADKVPFFYYSPQVITPNGGPITGSSSPVGFKGVGYVPSGSALCRFGTKTSKATFISDSRMECLPPATTAPGIVEVGISIDGKQFSNSSHTYQYYDTFNIQKVTPDRGPATAPTLLLSTLTGIKLTKLDVQPLCKAGTYEGIVQFKDYDAATGAANITCEIKAAIGAVPIFVALNGFDFEDTGFLFTFIQVFAVTPFQGPVSGGSEVIIAGTGFAQTPNSKCYFGITAVNAIVLSSAQVRCVAPFNKPETVQVEFNHDANAGVPKTDNRVDYLYYEAPVVTAVEPKAVPSVGGTPITVFGKNIFGSGKNTLCRFGRNQVVGFAYNVQGKGNVLECVAPAETLEVDVEISLNNGYAWTSDGVRLTYIVASAVDPTFGPTTGGTIVTVTGSGFRADLEYMTWCQFGTDNTTSKAVRLDNNRLTCESPSFANITTKFVTVSLLDTRQWTTTGANFEYYQNPEPREITPDTGPANDPTLTQWVTIIGTGFFPSAHSKCKFGNVLSSKVEYLTKDSVRCTAPASQGVVDVFVTMNAQNWIAAGVFYYYSVVEIEPPIGPGAGGTIITVRGDGFRDKENNSTYCRFGKHVSFATVLRQDIATCVVPGNGEIPRQPPTLTLNNSAGAIPPNTTADDIKKNQTTNSNQTNSKSNSSSSGPSPSPSSSGNVTLLEDLQDELRESKSDGGAQIIDLSLTQTTTPAPANATTPSLFQSNDTAEITMNQQDFARPLTDAGVFKYYRSPIVTAVVPDNGELAGGDEITVYGDSFLNTTYLSCMFGPCQAGVSKCSKVGTYLSSTHLTCYSPPSGSGQVVVTVSNNDQQFHRGAIYEYKVCRAGWYSKTLSSSCIKCPNGTFSALPASLECKRCSETSYTLSEATVNCTQCPENTHIPGDSRQALNQCQCRPGFYHPGGMRGFACVPCPEGASCAGDIEPPSAIPGFWGSPDVAFVFMACDIPEACPGGPPEECNIGYGGRFCARCTPGFYQLNKYCEVCPDLAEWILVMFGVFAVLVVIFLVKMVGMNASAYGGTIGLATQFFQTIGLINKLNLKWPEALRRAFEFVTGPFTFSIDILATECSFPVSYRSKWVSTLLMPIYFGFLFICVYIGAQIDNAYKEKNYEQAVETHLVRIENPEDFSSLSSWELDSEFEIEEPKYNDSRSLKNRLINAYFLFLSLVFLVIILTALEIFDCTDRGDQRFTLDVHPALVCYDTAWWIMLPLGIAGSFGYGVVVPTLFVSTVVRNTHRLNTPEFIERYGSVYSEYSRAYPWWEGMVMMQKLFLAIPVLYFSQFAEFQIVSFLFILFGGLCLNMIVRPYYIERYNMLQDLLKWCVIVILMCGMVFRRGKFPHWTVEYLTISAALFFVLGACVFILSVVLGDIIVTNVSLRKNVDAANLGCLHQLMHAHGKSEIMYWLGSARSGRNYQADLCQILTAIADDYESHKDADQGTMLDMSPMDSFINVYTGGTFMTPVVPFVRYWLLSRISQVEADDFFSTFARSEVETFVGCFAEFNNFRRMEREGIKVSRNAEIIEDDEEYDMGRQPLKLDEDQQQAKELEKLEGEVDEAGKDDDDDGDGDGDHTGADVEAGLLALPRRTTERELRDLKDLLRTLFLDLLSDKARKRLLDQLEEDDHKSLPYLMALVVNRNDMLTYQMDSVDFHKQRTIEYLLREHDRLNSKQPLVPYLHMLYENNFTDSAMYALGNLIESTEPDPSRDFMIDRRQPVWILHQLFCSTRLLGAEYSVFRKARVKKAPTEKRKGVFSSFGSALTTWFKPAEVEKKESKFFFSTGETEDSEEEDAGFFANTYGGMVGTVGGLTGMLAATPSGLGRSDDGGADGDDAGIEMSAMAGNGNADQAGPSSSNGNDSS